MIIINFNLSEKEKQKQKSVSINQYMQMIHDALIGEPAYDSNQITLKKSYSVEDNFTLTLGGEINKVEQYLYLDIDSDEDEDEDE